MNVQMYPEKLKAAPKGVRLTASTIGLLASLGVAGSLIAAGRAPAPAPAIHHATPQTNRHLHGVTETHRDEHREDHHKREFHHHWHHIWHDRWDYVLWLGAHRGTGTIIGSVRNSGEESVAGAHVVLRGPRGHYLKWSMKHLTTTDSAGRFVMRHVRPGAYRLHASSGKASGNAQISVHSGTILHESVRI
jgi:hypothetical protein